MFFKKKNLLFLATILFFYKREYKFLYSSSRRKKIAMSLKELILSEGNLTGTRIHISQILGKEMFSKNRELPNFFLLVFKQDQWEFESLWTVKHFLFSLESFQSPILWNFRIFYIDLLCTFRDENWNTC